MLRKRSERLDGKIRKWEGEKGLPYKFIMGLPEGLILPCIHVYVHPNLYRFFQLDILEIYC